MTAGPPAHPATAGRPGADVTRFADDFPAIARRLAELKGESPTGARPPTPGTNFGTADEAACFACEGMGWLPHPPSKTWQPCGFCRNALSRPSPDFKI